MSPLPLSNGKAILAALLLAAAFAAGWKTCHYQAQGDALRAAYAQAEGRVAAEKRRAIRDQALEEELGRLRASKRKTQIIREKEIAKPAYDCRLPGGGRVLLNGRIAAAKAARRHDAGVR